MELIRTKSFSAVGINDILKASDVPRGSFYHYFDSKEVFGLEVAQYYHDQQMAALRGLLRDDKILPLDRLKAFFRKSRREFESRKFKDGCLMCNLSTELADTNTAFRKLLKGHWREVSAEIAGCIGVIDQTGSGFSHLTSEEAADWLLNAWSGALSRMKAERNDAALRLFEKSVFLTLAPEVNNA